MSYFLFIAASSIEYFSIFMLIFALFRFRLADRLAYVLLVAFLMSQVSYFTRLNPEIGELSSFIQLLIFIILFVVLFRIPLFYSLVMNVAGFICGSVIQGLTILAFGTAGLTLAHIRENIVTASVIQVFSSVIILIAAILLNRSGSGFHFVPRSSREEAVVIKGTNAILLAVIVLGISTAFVVTFLFRNEYEHYILTSCTVFVLSLPFFIYYSIRKDSEDAR